MSIRSFKRAHARRVDRERRRMGDAKRRMLVASATVGASAVFAAGAQAATYTVTTNGDTVATSPCTNGQCTNLRDAITAANANPDPNGDTITFANGVAGMITLSQRLEISDSGGLTITGPGAGTLAISGNGDSQIFFIDPPSGTPVTISGLTLEDGNVQSSQTTSGNGGAIENDGASVSLVNDTITGSTAGGVGGGVYTSGPLSVSGSTITHNTASGGEGGGIVAESPRSGRLNVTITGTAIRDNSAQLGGGVAGNANFSISHTQITGNQATLSNQFQAGGGGIYAFDSSLDLADSTVTGNTSVGDGGGVDVKYIPGGETASVKTVAATGGASGIQIARTTIDGNTGASGGGVAIQGDGSNSPITISASTISNNRTSQAQGAASYGGGVLLTDSILSEVESPFDLIDSTVTGNSADHGGGVALGDGTRALFPNGSSGSAAFDNSTIAANTASTDGGGIFLEDYAGSPVGVNSTIVARNTANGSPQDLFGPTNPSAGGFNAAFSLIQAPPNAPLLTSQSVITGVDPQLGPLADNGGPTQTMLPGSKSPALDQGKAAAGLTTDQRGDARTVDLGNPKPPGGDGTDIGAVEVAAPVKPVVQPGPSSPGSVAQQGISALIRPATAVNAVHGTLHGKVNTNGAAVTWQFQYGRTTSYGKTTPPQKITAGHGQVAVSFPVKHLAPNTVYHFRLVAVSASGTATTADATFKTASLNVRPGVVLAGHRVRVFGGSGTCRKGDRVTLISNAFSPAHTFGGKPAVYATVGSGASYSVLTTIPAGRAPSRYAVTARCDGSDLGVTAFLRVIVPPTPKFTG